MILAPKRSTFGLHDSLIVPIGAKSKDAIEKYVGSIEFEYGEGNAFLVSFSPLSHPNSLGIWEMERSFLLTYHTQLWVHVDYRSYRRLYLASFGNVMEDSTHVVDHIMNRKLARSLGYYYVRLLHISRSSNSSAGRGGETLANTSLPTSLSLNPDINECEITYADPMDLMKMMNMNVGGFGLQTVAEHHHLIYG